MDSLRLSVKPFLHSISSMLAVLLEIDFLIEIAQYLAPFFSPPTVISLSVPADKKQNDAASTMLHRGKHVPELTRNHPLRLLVLQVVSLTNLLNNFSLTISSRQKGNSVGFFTFLKKNILLVLCGIFKLWNFFCQTPTYIFSELCSELDHSLDFLHVEGDYLRHFKFLQEKGQFILRSLVNNSGILKHLR